jgi:hypothetical protein
MQPVDDLAPLHALHTRDTVLLWEGSQGQISNYLSYFMALIVCGLLFPVVAFIGSALPAATQPYIVFGPLMPLAWLVWRSVVTRMHHYQLTGQRLLESSGVLNRETDEVELYRVKDIVVKRPILYRFLGAARSSCRHQTSQRQPSCSSASAIHYMSPICFANM